MTRRHAQIKGDRNNVSRNISGRIIIQGEDLDSGSELEIDKVI